MILFHLKIYSIARILRLYGKNRYLSGLNPNSVDISTLDNETRSLECLDLLNKS